MFTYTTGIIVSIIVIYVFLLILHFGTLTIIFKPKYYLFLIFSLLGWYFIILFILSGIVWFLYLLFKWIILSFKINNGIF